MKIYPIEQVKKTEKRLKAQLGISTKVDYGAFELKPRLDQIKKILGKTNYSPEIKEKALSLVKQDLKEEKKFIDEQKMDNYDPVADRVTVYHPNPFALAHELTHAKRRENIITKTKDLTETTANLLQDLAFSAPQLALGIRLIPLVYLSGIEAANEIITNIKAQELPRMKGKISKSVSKMSTLSYLKPVALYTALSVFGPKIIKAVASKLGPQLKKLV